MCQDSSSNSSDPERIMVKSTAQHKTLPQCFRGAASVFKTWLRFTLYSHEGRTKNVCVYIYIYIIVCMCVCVAILYWLCLKTHGKKQRFLRIRMDKVNFLIADSWQYQSSEWNPVRLSNGRISTLASLLFNPLQPHSRSRLPWLVQVQNIVCLQ